jgi:hypothetical protein
MGPNSLSDFLTKCIKRMNNFLDWLCLCIASLLGYQPISLPNPVWNASRLALVPASFGAYSEALSRVIVNSTWQTA